MAGFKAIQREEGSVRRDPALVEAEVVHYFEALFRVGMPWGFTTRPLCIL